MSPAERHGPSEAAVREQLREQPGPRASSAPAEGREPPAGGAPREVGVSAEGGSDAGFVETPTGTVADEAEPGAVESSPHEDEDGGAFTETGVADLDESAGEAGAEPGDPLGEAERRRDEYLALAQRTQADFDNFRRRAARDTAAAGARAKAGLVRELLPAVDNLERALAAAGEADDGFARGVQMVHGEIVGALARSGVEGYEPNGEPFDPNLHEALSTRPSDGEEAGVVVEVVEKGYRLGETVLRPARVIVSA